MNSKINSFFYCRLAAVNIKKNSGTYIPYMLSGIGTVIMYYIMYALSVNRGMDKISGGPQLKVILSLGANVIAVFAAIFLFYTNSFLIKRRKKEFGLFNVLGMEKKHISRVLFFETVFVTVIILIAGLTGGILFSKLVFLALLKLVSFKVQYGFEISIEAITASLILFGVIFMLTLLNTLRQIHLSKPVELLKGSQIGEKEPKTRWVTAVSGLLLLGTGYYIAVATESPLAAIELFFVAVLLVIAGTYCLFTAGSIALLKMLRKNKGYYYKTRHFISVSGMIYRMKQNAAGLANICILSTMVLVMLSTTVAMYVGMEDVLRTRYPRNIVVDATDVSDRQVEVIDKIVDQEIERFKPQVDNVLKMRFKFLAVIGKNKDTYSVIRSGNNAQVVTAGIIEMFLIPLSEFNRINGTSYTLDKNEVLIHTVHGSYDSNTITIGDATFNVKGQIDEMETVLTNPHVTLNNYYVIVPDKDSIKAIIPDSESTAAISEEIGYFYGFDSTSDSKTQIELTKNINWRVRELGVKGGADGAESSKESFLALYGGLLFIGIFLGFVFIMATVLIIYYKQISEGFDDRERFEIMQKVGLSRDEVKASIRSQVLTVFFLPIVVAGVHVAFSFKMITKILALLNLTNIKLFALVCVGALLVFTVFYAVVYSMTSRVYFKIVSESRG